jgi:hypothetical protein
MLLYEQNRGSIKGGLEDSDELYPLIFDRAGLKLNPLAKGYFQPGTRGGIFVKVDRSPASVITDQP